MEPIYVTGHRNPDTDSIVAAMAYAALRNALGDREYVAARLGHVSDEQRVVYETVLKAQLAVLDAAKPGVLCSDMDKLARDIIEKDYPGTFGHGLGHGVGFEIHEWPRFSYADHTVVEPGMVITDEPGIYLEGKFGVRIEDMILITEDGCRSLTKSPKELIEL